MKGQNLLTSVDTKTNSPFYGMIARTKSYVFTEIFVDISVSICIGDPLLACAVNVLYICFSKQKLSSSKTMVSLENIARNISCEDDMEMTSLFRVDAITL